MYNESSANAQKRMSQVYDSLKAAMETLYQMTYDEYDRSETLAFENMAERVEEIMEEVSQYCTEISPEDLIDDFLYGRLQ